MWTGKAERVSSSVAQQSHEWCCGLVQRDKPEAALRQHRVGEIDGAVGRERAIRADFEQAVLAVRDAVVAPEPALAKAFAKPGKPVPIGAAIGKPVRRSLLDRVFSRR